MTPPDATHTDARNRHEGRSVVLTGANRGTGLAIAEALHETGWRVWALGRTPVDRPWARHVHCDLRRPEEVARAVRRAATEAGRLDAVVANAAVRAFGTVDGLPLDRWREATEVNLTSVVALAQACLPHLRASGGRIALMGSHAGTRFFEGGAAYCATPSSPPAGTG